jgi:hypothetical protein
VLVYGKPCCSQTTTIERRRRKKKKISRISYEKSFVSCSRAMLGAARLAGSPSRRKEKDTEILWRTFLSAAGIGRHSSRRLE